MTVIAAVVDEDGVVYMGADSAGYRSDQKMIQGEADPKVFRLRFWPNGRLTECLVGFAGPKRFHQEVEYRWDGKFEAKGSSGRVVFALVAEFGRILTAALPPVSLLDDNDLLDGSILVGFDGRLYQVGSDLGFTAEDLPYAAIGMGGDTTRGALAALWMHRGPDHLNTEYRLRLALGVALRHCDGVDGPFQILKVDPINPKGFKQPDQKGEGDVRNED